MATVYKKPNSPFWFAQFTDADGKRISRTTGTEKKREASRIAEDFESAARKRKNSQSGLPAAYSKLVEAAANEAVSGELTLARAEELITRLHRLANPSFRVVSLEEYLGQWIKAQEHHVEHNTIRVYLDMQRRMLAALGPKASSAPVGELTKEQVEKALVKIIKKQGQGHQSKHHGSNRQRGLAGVPPRPPSRA